MGLDAVVFRNAEKLAKSYDVTVVDVDRRTGEARVAQRDVARLPRDAFIAVERRLGNLDEVARLREIIAKELADPESVILRKVLYSAFQSGDVISAGELAGVRRELAVLTPLRDARLDSFISSMSELLDAAEAEPNPIAFV